MYYLNFPRSISSIGLGEQGTASQNSADALIYNPANLTNSKNIEFTYFRNPFYQIYDRPLTSIRTSLQVPNIGCFGLEYYRWSFGRILKTTIENPEGTGEYFDAYQHSFSVAFARNFSEELSAGIQIRYAEDKFLYTWDKFLFSAGVIYNPDIFDKRITLGFSFTNFGTPIIYEFDKEPKQSDPPPAKLNLGIVISPISIEFNRLSLYLQFSKIFDERGANQQAQSSFKTLFTDWKDFPRDVTSHIGLAFQWLPLNLGNGFSFSQDFYIGNISSGSKVGIANFFTHGTNVRIGYNAVRVSLGYAGWWHNIRRSQYLGIKLPRETFQFTLTLNENLIFKGTEVSNPIAELNKIILYAGTAYTFRIGRSRKEISFRESLKNSNSASYHFESDFYIDKNNALVSSFAYQTVPKEYVYQIVIEPVSFVSDYSSPKQYVYKTKFENLMFSTSYRLHLFETFQPFYIQGGLGIIRMNPAALTYPKYDYKTFVTISTGALVNILDNFYLKPSINFISIFNEVSGSAPRLGGYNQIDVGLKVGYEVF